MFSKAGENRLLLNIGGIGNFTYLPADQDASAVFTTDTGPGNTLLDAYAQRLLGTAYDKDGALASQGTVHEDVLKALKENHFFEAVFPKTTGPEVFNVAYVEEVLGRTGVTLTDANLMRTLVQFSAETIAEAIQRVLRPEETYHIYLSGGGAHNPVLVSAIRQLLPDCQFGRTDDIGVNGDAKEAVLFAVLANETLAGSTTSFGERQGVPTAFMGKISFPR
jgi:anhydro-N-acetylmuramic acid kinase